MGADEYVPGETALNFDGANDYVVLVNSTSLHPTGDFTISAWVNPRSYTGANMFVTGHRTITKQGLRFGLNPSTGAVYLRVGNSTDFATVTGGTVVPLDEWSMITGMRSGNEISVWLNADKDPTTGTLTGAINYERSYTPEIGQWLQGDINEWDGLIDEVRISNIARTSGEIDASWNSGDGERFVVDGNTAGLWHMDEGSGSTISDETGINNGIISGATWVDGFEFSAEAPTETISKIVFTNPERTVIVNQASGAMTIQAQDEYGSPRSVSGDTTINLDSTSGGGEFSPSDTRWAPTTSVTIPDTQSSATFYYKDSAIGTPTITAAEDPSTGWTDATQNVTIQGPVRLYRAGILDSTYLTIQEAVDTAIDNDTIIVLPGTYNEQIVIDKQVTVKSTQGGAATTIIDAQFGIDVVCDFGEGVTAHLPA